MKEGVNVPADFKYSIGEQAYLGYVAQPAQAAPGPCVMVCPTIMGVTDFERGKAEWLASLGYTAFVMDPYGEGRANDDRDHNATLMNALLADRHELLGRLQGSFEEAVSLAGGSVESVAAIGFCFGGLCALDLARSGVELAGVAAFHGLFTPPPYEVGKISAKVVCFHGYDDPLALPDAMTGLADEMTAAGADWQIHAYGNTGHAFTNPLANAPENGLAFQADANRRSFQALENFLAELFPPAG